jgi:DNA-binding FrmR family transcriptional regulator
VAALERAMEQEAPSSDILVLLLSTRESLNVVVREMLGQTIRSYMSPGESTEVGSTLSRVDTLVVLLRSYVR